MRLWLIDRKGPVDWDQYDAFVIRAETLERALEIARDHAGWGPKNNIGVPLEHEGEEEIVLGSFNAG